MSRTEVNRIPKSCRMGILRALIQASISHLSGLCIVSIFLRAHPTTLQIAYPIQVSIPQAHHFHQDRPGLNRFGDLNSVCDSGFDAHPFNVLVSTAKGLEPWIKFCAGTCKAVTAEGVCTSVAA